MATTQTVTLKRSQLRIDGGTQPRFAQHQDTIDKYAGEMEDGVTLPNLKACFDGKDHWLYDGFLRLAAGDKINREEWEVDVRNGTREEAVWLSYSANGAHGLPLTTAELDAMIVNALQHPEAEGKTEEALARHLHVGRGKIRFARTRMATVTPAPVTTTTTDTTTSSTTTTVGTAAPSTPPAPAPKREGVDGKMYPAPSARKPREAKPKADTPKPIKEPKVPPADGTRVLDAARRQIDKEDFFNLSTARDHLTAIRQRLIEAKQQYEALQKSIKSGVKRNSAFSLHPSFKTITRTLEPLASAITDLGKVLPHTACTYCKGEGTCETCKDSRWITELQFEDCPDEVRKVDGPTMKAWKSTKKKAA